MPAISKMRPMPPAAGLLLTSALLISACVNSTGSATSETERAICRELRRDLPTYSTGDTDATKEAGVRFLTAFNAVCS